MTDEELESQMRKLSRDLTNQCSFTDCSECIGMVDIPEGYYGCKIGRAHV